MPARDSVTGQWIDSTDGQRWWFDSGATALDFMYTTDFRTDFDSFVATGSLGEWLVDRFPRVEGTIDDRALADARALRSAITGLALSASRAEDAATGDIDLLNLYAATPDIPPVLAGASRQAGRSAVRAGQALSAIAREAVGIFDESNRGRIRECSAEDCQLVFFDDSRAGSRRWCSMQRCGNRAKVRAWRAKN
jgi:predicted RNA-binding Zn ribbon-like protein